MHFDLSTLYFLAVGTLLLSAGMTLWERHARPERRRELGLLASGYFALAVGCVIATARDQMPGVIGTAVSNITTVAGYLLVLAGVARLNGREYNAVSFALILAMTAGWVVAGSRWQDGFWSYVGALPIGLACAATAWEMLRSSQFRSLRSRRIVVAVAAGHAALYTGRAFVLPALAASFGPTIVSIAGKVTIYEGVLYSVGLPMALLALIREEAHAQLMAEARTDHLTGLGNRRRFFEQGEPLVRSSKAHEPLSLLAFDLDHFKRINDRFGHAAGDEVLKLFAWAVESKTGADAIVARSGGEEFVALLPGHGSLRAMNVAQAIAASFSQAVARRADFVGLTATVSIGVAELGRDGSSLHRLLSAADRALYVAKARGRNRVEFASLVDLALAS